MELLRVQLEVDPALIVDPDAHPDIVAEIARLAAEVLADQMAARLLQTVAAEHGVTVADLAGRSREAALTAARHAAMAALVDAGVSSVQAGRLLGGRDHTTVLSGVKRHRQRVAAAAAAAKPCDHDRCDELAMAGGRWCLRHFHAHVDRARRRRREAMAKSRPMPQEVAA
jgi:putative intracellular protease/amidase